MARVVSVYTAGLRARRSLIEWLDPGIKINIHSAIKGYTVPGPAVIAEGTTVTPGKAVCATKRMRGENAVFGL